MFDLNLADFFVFGMLIVGLFLAGWLGRGQ